MLFNAENNNVKNKKLIFDDEGEILPEAKIKEKKRKFKETSEKNFRNNPSQNEFGKKWYEIYSEFNISDEVVEMKDSEQLALDEICKKAYDDERSHFLKSNPSDARWLETALHKGTSKDRCNAGALLLTTNAIGNIPTLETVIGFARLSNKACTEVIGILTELFMEALIPSDRKLISIQLRGASWKYLKKQENLNKETKNKIYAYWHFENKLKDLYFEFLKNLQTCLQSGQDTNKNSALISASKLLAYAPEKEQMILSMLINKLGDPSSKVAAKTLHHLTEVSHKHPNMCGVITKETEKLLFRANISEKAQHFALCFLGQILPPGYSDVSTKVVNICFSLFKVLVKKGAVNNRTMQAILRCLQKAIVDAKPIKGEENILNKDMEDTIYRLIHLADIKISIQTLNLLLQIITIKSEKPDRFYNALYSKLCDLDLMNIGNTTAAQLLQILHKGMYIDKNISRIKAFIKRLLQIALYLPPNFACGCLIVINKVLKARKEIQRAQPTLETSEEIKNEVKSETLSKFDGDGEENYKDAETSDIENEQMLSDDENKKNVTKSSWHHIKVETSSENKSHDIGKVHYNAYHRVPAFCGAETIQNWELLQLQEHFHPSLKVFAQNIIELKKISYYGDPLRDFGLPYFLERFSFKNPKKQAEHNTETEEAGKHHKHYIPYGGRNVSVKNLTKDNCPEDEFYIFNYLEKKRESQQTKVKSNVEEEIGDDVDDDEFEDYLDGLVKQTKNKNEVEDDEDFEIDYMKELENDLNMSEKEKKSKKSKKNQDSDDEAMDDWEDDEDDDFDMNGNNGIVDSDGGSISLDGDDDQNDDDEDSAKEDENEEDENISDMSDMSSDENAEDDENTEDDENAEDDDSDEDDTPKKKKTKYDLGFKNFKTALKEKQDMKSLFAAVDDFADILDNAGKSKDHGTSKEVFNKDKASVKQIKWEEKRRSNYKDGKNWKKVKSNKNQKSKNQKKFKGKGKKK